MNKGKDIFKGLANRADLLWALSKRDILQKYRGSMLGLCWSFITPLVLLGIYTVVFGTIIKMSWGPEDTGLGGFAIMLFCGMIPFNFFSEVLTRSSQVIPGSPNYVKRISFPTEILPFMVNISGLVHALISLVILMIAQLLLVGEIAWTAALVVLVWIPVVISALACSLFVAAVGVFVRDLPHFMGLAFSALFFLTPIIYPASRVPEKLRFILFINPIAFAASNIRKLLVYGLTPNWISLLLYTAVSLAALYIAMLYFDNIKRRFADVI
jgi:lipopolysaccharide transport system permease protein